MSQNFSELMFLSYESSVVRGSGTNNILWFLCYWVTVQRSVTSALVQVAQLCTMSSSTQVWYLVISSLFVLCCCLCIGVYVL